ncbi:hypothetical protein [Nonomuraea sp. PA05]|uniref:hypothetical protein n=1 Tax=Nonomuraea sp. PA05 TaxID=2604466 RepID=UPI0039837C73
MLDDDVARLSPLIRRHINVHGRCSFQRPQRAAGGERPAQAGRAGVVGECLMPAPQLSASYAIATRRLPGGSSSPG